MAPLVTVESSHAAERLRGIRNRGEGSGLTATFANAGSGLATQEGERVAKFGTGHLRARESLPSLEWVPRRAPSGAPFFVASWV